MNTGLRATPRARVLVCLELALEDNTPDAFLDGLLELLGMPLELDVEDGPVARLRAAEYLVEAEQLRRDLDTRGRDALDLDDVPRGVSLTRLLDDERERAYGEVDRLVEAIAARLRP